MKTLVIVTLLVSSGAVATHGAEEPQDGSPMEAPMMDGAGDMMGIMGMMEQMNAMMSTCTKMMQSMMDNSSPGMQEGPHTEMPVTPEGDD